jgi:1-pyrroline-5-carboxylate dehydrogenase
MSASSTGKITYTVTEVADEHLHERFDGAVSDVKSRLGQRHPFYIADLARSGSQVAEEIAPGDRNLLVGSFDEPSAHDIDDAVRVAARGFRSWSRTSWQDRAAILERAAEEVAARKFELAALLSIEIGKPRLEALGDVDETIELITLYCRRFRDHDGFRVMMTEPGGPEQATSVMRPYGVWLVIAPFNFPLPLAAGPAAAALVAGNTVLVKPSYQGYLATFALQEAFRQAGLPQDVFQVLPGSGSEAGAYLVGHPDIAGVTFTGSHEVGMSILRESARRPAARPVICEMGGKNATIVTASAAVRDAAEGVARAAFGYSGQKCSACSRVYVQDSVAGDFLEHLREVAATLKVTDPVLREAFTGPVINKRAVERFTAVVGQARADGQLVTGGTTLDGPDTPSDQYVALTVTEVRNRESRLLRDEFFLPFVAVHRVAGLEEGLTLMNQSSFGLTAGLFAEDPGEVAAFLADADAGVLYVNRRAGSTTGAWPGVQTFSGWKGSGTTSRGTGGYYYVDQYMREQSQTIMRG